MDEQPQGTRKGRESGKQRPTATIATLLLQVSSGQSVTTMTSGPPVMCRVKLVAMHSEQPDRTKSLHLSNNPSAGFWIRDAVHNSPTSTVQSLVGNTFDAYARIFHAAQLTSPKWPSTNAVAKELRWSQVAQMFGRTAHPAMEWGALTGTWDAQIDAPSGADSIERPATGRLSLGLIDRLSEILTKHTTTATQCWFGVWYGYGNPDLPDVELLQMPRRPMFVFSGPITSAATPIGNPSFAQHANLWWPNDRAWCVATEIDLMSTYVGGSVECIDDIVTDEHLEAMPVPPDQRVTWDTDTINPMPPRPY